MSEVAVSSSPVQMPAEMCFQFPNGDTHATPSSATAAGFLWFTLRQILACGQATYWFHRGTGDTVIAPFYRVAVQRGVQFKFLRKVEHIGLSGDGASVATIELAVQATTIDDQPYQPLVRMDDGTFRVAQRTNCTGSSCRASSCAPSTSIWSRGGRPWQPVAHETLRVGTDFDQVVLAVPLPCLPHIAPELVTTTPWSASVVGLGGLATLSSQIWTTRTSSELGLPTLDGTDRVCGGAAVPPLGFADMTDVLSVEQWGPADEPAPQGLYYFCGPLQHEGAWPPFERHDTPAVQRNAPCDGRAVAAHGDLGDAHGRHPSSDPSVVRLRCAVVPAGPSTAQGEERFAAQYWRANIDPNERYVPSPPGSVGFRPKAWESGFTNVALASDWIFTGINIGSFEGAVMSGMLAAYALTGAPLPSAVCPGYDFGRPV